MMGGETLTASQLASHARSKAFRAHIDTLAQKLKVGTEAPVPKIFVEAEPAPAPIAEPIVPRGEFWFHIEEHRGYPSIARIQEVVCDHFGLSKLDLVSERRDLRVARPRQLAMYLARKLTPRSLPEIGRRFGDRDHTTAIAAIRRIEQVRQSDPNMEAAFRALVSRLGGAA